jgi:hypothetical protein
LDVLCRFPARPYFNSPFPLTINLFAAAFFVLVPLQTMLNGMVDPTNSVFILTTGLFTNEKSDLLCIAKGALLLNGRLLRIKRDVGNRALLN